MMTLKGHFKINWPLETWSPNEGLTPKTTKHFGRKQQPPKPKKLWILGKHSQNAFCHRPFDSLWAVCIYIRMFIHKWFYPHWGTVAAKTHLQWIMNVTIPHSHLFFFFCNAEVHFGNFHEYSDHNIIGPVKVIQMVTRYTFNIHEPFL